MQPSQAQWKRVSGTAAGTTVVFARNGSFERIVLGQNKTGTATFYDTDSASGTAATNYIATIDNTSGTVPHSVEVGIAVKKGLTVVVGGTVDMTVIYN